MILRRVLILCFFSTLTGSLRGSDLYSSYHDTKKTPPIYVAYEPDILPPAGQSLFDVYYYSQEEKPQTYLQLVDGFASFYGLLAIHDGVPFGRSLKRFDARKPLKSPRLLSAFIAPPLDEEESLDGLALVAEKRNFFGFVMGKRDVEIISFNHVAGRFEFQILLDFGTEKQRLVYANRNLCMACHQNGGPLFSNGPWNETISRPFIEKEREVHMFTRVGREQGLDPDTTELIDFDGIKIRKTLVNKGVSAANKIDRASAFSDQLIKVNRMWRSACEGFSDRESCSRALLQCGLQLHLDRHQDIDKSFLDDRCDPLIVRNVERMTESDSHFKIFYNIASFIPHIEFDPLDEEENLKESPAFDCNGEDLRPLCPRQLPTKVGKEWMFTQFPVFLGIPTIFADRIHQEFDRRSSKALWQELTSAKLYGGQRTGTEQESIILQQFDWLTEQLLTANPKELERFLKADALRLDLFIKILGLVRADQEPVLDLIGHQQRHELSEPITPFTFNDERQLDGEPDELVSLLLTYCGACHRASSINFLDGTSYQNVKHRFRRMAYESLERLKYEDIHAGHSMPPPASVFREQLDLNPQDRARMIELIDEFNQ